LHSIRPVGTPPNKNRERKSKRRNENRVKWEKVVTREGDNWGRETMGKIWRWSEMTRIYENRCKEMAVWNWITTVVYVE